MEGTAMATTIPAARISSWPVAPPHIRQIGLGDLRLALVAGWRDFAATPTQLLFLGVIYPVVGLVAARAASGGDVLPLFWPLVAGLSLLGPVTALGLYEISRQREMGRPTSWLTAFQAFRMPGLFSFGVPAVYLLALFVLWVTAAQALWNGIMVSAGAAPTSLGELFTLVTQSPQGMRLLFWGNLVGFGFALAAFVGTVVSFPLLLDRPTDPGTAMLMSVRAVMANPVPMLAWGLVVAALLVLGSLPAFVGLAVVMPWLGHSTWHLYRRVVG
jgi:uncharacterized membrane protein